MTMDDPMNHDPMKRDDPWWKEVQMELSTMGSKGAAPNMLKFGKPNCHFPSLPRRAAKVA